MPKITPKKPVQERAEMTKAKILEVARMHFAERGFDSANTRDIAKDAGASHAMIRYHFGTKENLWRESIVDMFHGLREYLGFAEDGEPPDLITEERFREFIRKYIHYCAQHPEHSRIMISESIRGGERLTWMVEKFIRPAHQFYASVMGHHMEQENLPTTWLVSLIFMITAICQMPFVLTSEIKLLYDVDMRSDAAIEAHVDSVFTLLFKEHQNNSKNWPKVKL